MYFDNQQEINSENLDELDQLGFDFVVTNHAD